MQEQPKQLVYTKLNPDTHYSLLEQRDIVYMLNGDTQGLEGNNNNYFAQNLPSNSLCSSFYPGFEYVGGIQLDKFQYAIFLANGSLSEIGLLDTNTCQYTMGIQSSCLGFDSAFPIRGVYKANNKDNDRRIYWVDGKNTNKYLDFDKMMLGDYPRTHFGSLCDDCTSIELEELDCNKIRINKEFNIACLEIEPNKQGDYSTGTYQVAIAYGEDKITLTDFYFSDIVKVQSYKDDIGFEINIDCKDNVFSQFRLILISHTKENSLVVYDYGYYELSTKKITLNSKDTIPVIDSSIALSKRVVYDKSLHIVTNEETLLLGKHETVEPINYQLQANDIQAGWVERKVPSNKAQNYPTFLRDEVYALSIEWFDTNGTSRGVFPIPGRELNNVYAVTFLSNIYHENDNVPNEAYVYEDGDCDPVPTKVWQIENTATTLFTNPNATCELCTVAPMESKIGLFGYYECESITYPNDPLVWGILACQKVRHHRMPSSDLTHIHNQANCVQTGTGRIIYNYIEDPCINILGVRLEGVSKPLDSNGDVVEGIWKYRLLYSRREGNKSILHKGLIFNTYKETVEGEIIHYPNYPYNDLHADEFLSVSQTDKDGESEQHVGNADFSTERYTYHSPDIHFRETQNEFGTEVKRYTEEIGKIKGNFKPVYKHPTVGIGGSTPGKSTPFFNAQQFNSVANYSNYNPVNVPFRNRSGITYSQYLLPIKQIIDDSMRFNNFLRETSYYFKIDSAKSPMPIPLTSIDFSRIRRGMVGCTDTVPYCSTADNGSGDQDVQAVSYYVGIKQRQLNQYGQIDRIRYTPVEHCLLELEGEFDLPRQFYGGDTYISKHSVFRKMPLFVDWLYDVPLDTEINYRDHRNIYYPRYWYDNLSEVNDSWRFDCWDADAGTDGEDNGWFYIWVTGNLYFWGESEFIGNYREMDFTPQSRFYPKIDFNDIARVDTISLQQTFLYDFSLLNSSIETKFQSTLTKSDADFTVIYSLKNDLQSQADNWLKFLPLNYSILPSINGDFTGMHYTNQYSVWFIFENQILYSREDDTLQTGQGNSIFVGQGDIFSRRLQKLSNEKTGYSGSVDPLSFINTRFGTFYFDRYRSNWFKWDGQLHEINDMGSWLDKYTNSINPGYTGSMISVFDNMTGNIFFTEKNRWTLSYKPESSGFNSWHSFIPNNYLTLPNSFISINDFGFWKHNASGYGKYFGIQYPFDIGMVYFTGQTKELQSIEVFTDWIKYDGPFSPVYSKDKFFDKVLVYNNNGSTGYMTTLLKDKNNPIQSLTQNKETLGVIEVSQVLDNTYRFNKLENNQSDMALPNIQFDTNGVIYNPININYNKDIKQREDIKGRWFKVHLRTETNNDHKILVQLLIPGTDILAR